jgi:peptide/nickel transport system ATP-binding protein
MSTPTEFPHEGVAGDGSATGQSFVTITGLRKHYISGGGLFGKARQEVRAIADVSLRVRKGEAVGLVGESGCGKSTVARAVLRLVEPDDGVLDYDGVDIRGLAPRELREFRRRAQLIFQDPYASLNPRRTVRQTLEEPLHVHGMGTPAEIAAKVEAAITEVGLAVESLDRFAYEFSGGQRQRIGIARALILQPEFIVADEPVSALDVSVQAQILELLQRLKDARGLSFLFVSHDLGVIRHFCTSTNVMYLGRIVEVGPTDAVLDKPRHPYTRLLRDSSPIPDPAHRIDLSPSAQELPSAANPPPGCAFHPRCPRAAEVCRTVIPVLAADPDGRQVACHFPL